MSSPKLHSAPVMCFYVLISMIFLFLSWQSYLSSLSKTFQLPVVVRYLYFLRRLSLEKGLHWICSRSGLFPALPGPSASWAADRERERVPKRDWNYNRLACIFVPLHDHSERRYLKIAPVIYITLSAVLSLSSGTRGGAIRGVGGVAGGQGGEAGCGWGLEWA